MISTKDKTYEITIKFKVNGEIPDMIVEEHVAGNIESEMEDKPLSSAIDQIELWGEYYGDYPDVWSLFHDGSDIEVSAREMTEEEVEDYENERIEANKELQEAADDYKKELDKKDVSFTIYHSSGDTQIIESSAISEKNEFTFLGFGNYINPYFITQLKWVDIMLSTKGIFLNRKTVKTYKDIVSQNFNEGYFEEDDVVLPEKLIPSSDGYTYFHVQDEEMGRGWSILMRIDKKNNKEIIAQDHRDNVRDYLFNEFVQEMGVDLEFIEVDDLDKIEI